MPRTIVFAALVATATLLAGCGSAGSIQSRAAVVARAPKLTVESFVETVAAAERDAGSVIFELSAFAGPTSIAGSGALIFAPDGSPRLMSMTAQAEGEHFDIRVLDGALYLMSEDDGDVWTRVPAMKAGTKTAALYDDMVGSMNPIEMVDDLATGMTSIVATGRTKKTSEGVRVWEYEVTLATAERVDLAMEAAEGGPAVRAQLESLADELGPEIAATYWIGRNALLYEATVQMGPIGSSVVYESWGGEVGVVAPPPGDVEEVDPEAFEAALG